MKYGHFQISLEYCDGWAKNFVETDNPYVVLWKPIVPCFFCCHGSTDFHKNTVWKVCPATNSPLIRRKNPAKFENDRISRNGHRIKITQPNWMIKASFSSAEDAPSNDVKINNTFSSQCTEFPPFRFFWDTRYREMGENASQKVKGIAIKACVQVLKHFYYFIKHTFVVRIRHQLVYIRKVLIQAR